MALPPLPPSSTRRLFLDYTSTGFAHTMMLRLATGDDPAAYAATYANIFAQRMRDSEGFTGARLATVGSDVTLPVTFTPVPGVLPGSTSVWPQDPESVQLSFTWRGNATGRKGRVEFFTPVPTPSWPANNRYDPGYAAVIDTLRTNFVAAAGSGGTSPIIGIGGDEVTIHSYVNIRSNSYWQNRQR